jgi:hypothetical protein
LNAWALGSTHLILFRNTTISFGAVVLDSLRAISLYV